MLGEIHLSKGNWLQAERELREVSKLGRQAVSQLPHRGVEGRTRMSSKLAMEVLALCATHKRAWALARLGRTTLARKVLRDCARSKRLEGNIDSAAASVRRACAADERQLHP